jgi:hypothetical protein
MIIFVLTFAIISLFALTLTLYRGHSHASPPKLIPRSEAHLVRQLSPFVVYKSQALPVP